MSTIFCPVLSRNFLSDLKTNLTKFELSTTFRAQDMQPVKFLLERLFSLWVYTVSVFRTFFYVRKTHPLFLRTYMQTVYAHPFFCRPDESASANFTYASIRAWLYFCPLPFVSVGHRLFELASVSVVLSELW